MSNKRAPHATAAIPQANSERATLLQLSEVVALMHHGKLSRQYMQDFLRFRLVKAGIAIEIPATENRTLLWWVEQTVQKYYPHAVNEILEVVAPLCDQNFRFDLQQPDDRNFSDRLRKAVFWQSYPEYELHKVDSDYRKPGFKGMGFPEGPSFSSFLREGIFFEEFRTFYHLDPNFEEGAKQILRGGAYLSDHLHKRYYETGPQKYKITGPFEMEGWLGSITWAIDKAVVFASKNDLVRLKQVSEFLKFQISGTPIYHFHNSAHVLCI